MIKERPRPWTNDSYPCEVCGHVHVWSDHWGRFYWDPTQVGVNSSFLRDHHSHCGLLSHDDIHPDPLAGKTSNNFTVLVCDRCCPDDLDPAQMQAVVARRLDATGGGYTDNKNAARYAGYRFHALRRAVLIQHLLSPGSVDEADGAAIIDDVIAILKDHGIEIEFRLPTPKV